jgi:cytochrome c-type biogenesis protein CcmH/NrfG
VALSDEEQRLLDQMEAALAAEDPKLVNALRGTGTRRVHRRRAAIAGVVGVSAGWFWSVLGFVIMVAAAVTAIYSWPHVGTGNDPGGRAADRPKAPQSSGPDDGQGFMDKMEERWRRRRDETGGF